MYRETMQSLFEQAFANYKDRTAIKFKEREYTYAQIEQIANQCSWAMIELGIEPGERSALLMSNCPEFIMADLAIMKTGTGKVPLNDMLVEKEIQYILQDSEAKILFVGPNFFDVILKIKANLPHLKYIVAICETEICPPQFIPWSQFISQQPSENPQRNTQPDDLYLLAYTGGTTGLPKGVYHTQRNGYINICSHIIETEIVDGEKMLLSTPLSHSAGLFTQTGLLRGATIVLEQKFNPTEILNIIEKEKITFTFMVPTMIYRILDELKENTYDVSSINTIIYGAAPITEQRLKEGLDRFGPVFLQFFGQTECPNFVTKLSKRDHSLNSETVHRLKSCGRPVLMCNVKVVGPNGELVSLGEEGEIVVQSPYVMNEYYKLPEKTKETVQNGWLYTGDVGKIDEDGYVYLLDRKKDMVISGGMNVYTTEVENVLQQHPAVSQVAVIGVPHEDWGEAVLALVIPADDHANKDEILFHCSQLLSKYKRPKDIEFVKSFPLTPYGKLDKKALRAKYWGTVERSVN
ncbi:long-chain-fatty-acid--CoA ligase [Alkalihalobacterium alkalinitrilicum]|uniref:long-chain-fatty-acid--CoA ligase n=1 Tax=Alkalihalobacterium alkalinitrilicum TaxID=427920 RepID=UPI0009958590|nr:long-chain-fatty-acid--CoA ligase [Alkalihalobacterium alkalinitrilicum]